jgi:hypothetical protein
MEWPVSLHRFSLRLYKRIRMRRIPLSDLDFDRTGGLGSRFASAAINQDVAIGLANKLARMPEL